jgi:hypothetical protein
MKFTSFKNWLFERKKENLNYSCLMLYADIPNWKEKTNFIFKDDIYEKDGDYGYEKEPHVTVVYGFHDDEVDKKELYEKIEELIRPLTVTIQKISFFECEDYDVVKFEVPISSQLRGYRKAFLKFPNTQTYKKYEPHMTICYVKKGEGERYAKKLEKSFKVKFNKAVYSTPDENKKYFDLK